jgi:hypothetical protein
VSIQLPLPGRIERGAGLADGVYLITDRCCDRAAVM